MLAEIEELIQSKRSEAIEIMGKKAKESAKKAKTAAEQMLDEEDEASGNTPVSSVNIDLDADDDFTEFNPE